MKFFKFVGKVIKNIFKGVWWFLKTAFKVICAIVVYLFQTIIGKIILGILGFALLVMFGKYIIMSL